MAEECVLQTGEKNKYGNWMNKEAEECVFHLLKSSGEVRRRTQVVHDLRPSCVMISQGEIQMLIKDENIDWDLIDDIKNSASPQAEGSAITKEGHKSIDPVLDGLVESLKKEAEGTDLSVISKAVEEGNAEQLDLLLQAGVSPDIEDSTGIRPLQRASEGKMDEICLKLIETGADHENTVVAGEQLVVKAAQDNMTKLTIALIKAGDLAIESNGMRSLIHIAAENSNWEILTESVDP